MKHTSKGICLVRSSLVCGCILTILIGSSVPAATVYFGDLDRAPTNQLQIGDVTISGTPSTVSGLGLGAAGIGLGSNGTIDSTWGTNWARESLMLSVAGTINSFTILPYFTDLANPDQGFIMFEMAFVASMPSGQNLGYSGQICLNADPLTISLGPDSPYSRLDLTVLSTSSFGEGMYFMSYWEEHPDAQLLFGYTVQSLDYTPIPEPSTFSFVLLSVTATLLRQAKKRNLRRSSMPRLASVQNPTV